MNSPSPPDDRRPGWRRFLRPGYGLGLAVLLALAIGQRASLSGELIRLHLTPDSWGYVGPIHAWLDGGGWPHGMFREFLYPYLAALCLKAGGDYRLLGWVQMVASLLGPVFVLAAWDRARRMLPATAPAAIVHVLAGWWLAIVLLFHGGHLVEASQVG